ncbi:MAG: 1-acyl-sn-glycerol-3-phosphate acyltransferase [Gemmatimonadaceae bacterium]|nr:1-acyl-sn-glycerol-3-phosphate acyltransferase [Gemmatimonadaceae bacterium]
MRSLLVGLAMLVFTPLYSAVVVLASLLGVPEGPDSVYQRAARGWGRWLVRAAGVRTRIHGGERISATEPRVYVANHVSWYDVFTIASVLPRWSFVAKAELRRIPIFGPAAEAVGTVFIERQNRKAAFAIYERAAARIRNGASVVVCPEGTRGDDYALRAFKKGPFVLAIASGVPIVPVIVHGTRDVMPRGSWWIRAGTVDLHFLEPIPTAGLDYDDREALVRRTWTAMADAFERSYGVTSDRRLAGGSADEADAAPSVTAPQPAG